jgi:hypothetical protein
LPARLKGSAVITVRSPAPRGTYADMRILPHAHSHCNRLLHNLFAPTFCTCTFCTCTWGGDCALPPVWRRRTAGRSRLQATNVIAPAGRRWCGGPYGYRARVLARAMNTDSPVNRPPATAMS